MQSLQARRDSFKRAKRVKRYPNKSSSSSASIKWPHPPSFKANADTLAEAGFYFSPSWGDRDSVACFLCGKELSDWDASDDPFEIHYSKCQSSCGWAVVRCGLTEDLDDEERFVFHNKARLPSCRAIEKARLETFGEDWWPHDEEPGHGAASVKMAQAGFVYTPQTAGDDTVTCLYCNLSLSGWEAQDNPVKEHRDRGSDCPFFVFSSRQSSTTSKPRRKTKATRGKSVKASASISQRSPSPSQPISHEREEATVPDAPMDTVVPEPDTVTEPSEPLVNGSIHLLSDRPGSPPALDTANESDIPPPDTILNHPNPVISLSPTGQPTIASSELLTHSERTMSLEQWIRQEISLGYERLLTDGRRQIDLFKVKAAELRKCIDEL